MICFSSAFIYQTREEIGADQGEKFTLTPHLKLAYTKYTKYTTMYVYLKSEEHSLHPQQLVLKS